ncbi:MAG: hypothetical protein ACI4C3_02085 [Bacteroides sp.]
MRTYRQLAMGLLALVICIALPSCSDDDDENEKKEAVLEEQKGMVELLNLQTNLCVMNLQGEPTEATFGYPVSQANTAERIYYTKDLDSAKKRYQMLFHSDTRCSEDGNTYTLANKQGTATFAEADGNKGELAVATFDVPGLKGLVKKVHFIDHTQRGQNSDDEDFDELYPGCFVRVSANGTKWNAIALGPLKGSDDTWVLFTPSIQKDLKNYRATGFIDQTMLPEGSEKINIMDYTSVTDGEDDMYYLLRLNIWDFLFGKFPMYSDAEDNWNFVVANYGEYMKQIGYSVTYCNFYLQMTNDEMEYKISCDYTHLPNWTTTCIYNRHHMLLYYRSYMRNKTWNLSTTVVTDQNGTTTTETDLPDLFKEALPIWGTITTVRRGDALELGY